MPTWPGFACFEDLCAWLMVMLAANVASGVYVVWRERLALHGHGWEGCTGDTRVLALSLSILSLRVVCDCVFFARHVCVPVSCVSSAQT